MDWQRHNQRQNHQWSQKRCPKVTPGHKTCTFASHNTAAANWHQTGIHSMAVSDPLHVPHCKALSSGRGCHTPKATARWLDGQGTH